MGRKRIYECVRCVQYFNGKTAFDYHMNAHKRTDPPKRRELPPKRPVGMVQSGSGNEPASQKESS